MYSFFFFNDTATTEIYTLSLHDALPIFVREPARVARPVGEGRGAPEAGRVELGQDRADRHDADLFGDEEGTPRIGAGEDEAAERPLEADGVTGLEAAKPLGDEPAGRHVGAEREPRGGARRRGDRVGADGLRPERDRYPLARDELERRRLVQAEVGLEDLGREPTDRVDPCPALEGLHGGPLSPPGDAGGSPRRSSRAAPAPRGARRSRSGGSSRSRRRGTPRAARRTG